MWAHCLAKTIFRSSNLQVCFQAFRCLVDMMGMRQSGLLEVVDTIVGHPLSSFDAGHIYVNANASEKRDRMLKPKAVIQVNLSKYFKFSSNLDLL